MNMYILFLNNIVYIHLYVYLQEPAYNKKILPAKLCLSEMILISLADPVKSLNKPSEIISKCRHRDKLFYLKITKTPSPHSPLELTTPHPL